MLYDRKTGEKADLTPEFLDLWVGSFAWSPDSSFLFFTSEEYGRSPIWRVALDTKRPVSVLDGFYDDPSFLKSGELLVTQMSSQRPNEIFLATKGVFETTCIALHAKHLNCFEPAQLTHLNDFLISQISMSPLESFWFGPGPLCPVTWFQYRIASGDLFGEGRACFGAEPIDPELKRLAGGGESPAPILPAAVFA